MITPDEIKLLNSLLKGEKVADEDLEKLSKKMELIAKQIEIQDEANLKLEEIRKELAEI